jgi:hypothetical protein
MKFVIFGRMVWKLWISKDSAEIWFEILIEICFKPGANTWLFPIRWYRFVQIMSWGR